MANTDTKIPNPIYAAAGAGDLAMERLRKLPGRVAELQDRVQTELPGRLTELQDKVTQKVAEIPSFVAELRQRVVDADTDKLRESARRNAQTVLANAQAAQKRAQEFYAHLVAHGEEVVGRSMPTDTVAPVHAEVIATPSTAAVTESGVAEGVVTEAPAAAPKKSAGKGRKTA
jgi:heparin binding hemagglutinin HbhA